MPLPTHPHHVPLDNPHALSYAMPSHAGRRATFARFDADEIAHAARERRWRVQHDGEDARYIGSPVETDETFLRHGPVPFWTRLTTYTIDGIDHGDHTFGPADVHGDGGPEFTLALRRDARRRADHFIRAQIHLPITTWPHPFYEVEATYGDAHAAQAHAARLERVPSCVVSGRDCRGPVRMVPSPDDVRDEFPPCDQHYR